MNTGAQSTKVVARSGMIERRRAWTRSRRVARVDDKRRIRRNRDGRNTDFAEMDMAEREHKLARQRKQRERRNPAAIGSEPTHATASGIDSQEITNPRARCKAPSAASLSAIEALRGLAIEQ
jgi:hypothetical protein